MVLQWVLMHTFYFRMRISHWKYSMPLSDAVLKASVILQKNLIHFYVPYLCIYLFRDLNIYIEHGSLGLFLKLKSCDTTLSPVISSHVMDNQVDLHLEKRMAVENILPFPGCDLFWGCQWKNPYFYEVPLSLPYILFFVTLVAICLKLAAFTLRYVMLLCLRKEVCMFCTGPAGMLWGMAQKWKNTSSAQPSASIYSILILQVRGLSAMEDT